MNGEKNQIDEIYKELVNRAVTAMKESYAPYSKCNVGAALLAKDGRIYTGCNVENASFSATCCAERTAFFKAVSEGCRDFDAVAVVGGYGGEVKEFFPPCGVCRQVMTEFCGSDFKIILTEGREIKVFLLAELMPLSFCVDKVLKGK